MRPKVGRRRFVPAELAKEHGLSALVVQVDTSPAGHRHRSPKAKRVVSPTAVREPCREHATVRDHSGRESRLFYDADGKGEALRGCLSALSSTKADFWLL